MTHRFKQLQFRLHLSHQKEEIILDDGVHLFLDMLCAMILIFIDNRLS